MLWAMGTSDIASPAAFTAGERDHMRNQLTMLFSTLPSVADGFPLKTWAGGPQRGQPKVPQAAVGLVARGLMRLDASTRWLRLFFTDAGLSALRAMMADTRLADPVKFAHVRQELGMTQARIRGEPEQRTDRTQATASSVRSGYLPLPPPLRRTAYLLGAGQAGNPRGGAATPSPYEEAVEQQPELNVGQPPGAAAGPADVQDDAMIAEMACPVSASEESAGGGAAGPASDAAPPSPIQDAAAPTKAAARRDWLLARCASIGPSSRRRRRRPNVGGCDTGRAMMRLFGTRSTCARRLNRSVA